LKQILSIADQVAPLLRAARKSAGMNQTELAKRLNLSQSRLSAMELDPSSIRLDQLLMLCGVLQLELLVQAKSVSGNDTATSSSEW
jgi:HTH-type transcriptional regulator / antitoxin HipB